jgi:hypothetical protein
LFWYCTPLAKPQGVPPSGQKKAELEQKQVRVKEIIKQRKRDRGKDKKNGTGVKKM